MILHFLSDDIFSNYVIGQFSSPEMQSDFVVMSTTGKLENLQHTGSAFIMNPYHKGSMQKLIGSLHNYSAIVLHGLFYPWCEVVLRYVPDGVKVAWVFWGGEVYGRKEFGKTFLSKQSRKILWFRNVKLFLKKKKGTAQYEIPRELFRRIDYCLTDIHEDFEFVNAYAKSNMKEVWYNYYSVDETIGDMRDQFVEGNNILVGNSCTLACNHLDGFKAVRRIHDEDSEIVVPLSYGESWLRNLLLKKGRRMFGNRFHPLVDFMPRDEYNRIIKSCAVVIMPHYRPQAFGNLLTALWLGSRVYMSEKSLLYAFFKRIGVIVFSIETDFKKTKIQGVHPLSSEERELNRKLIASIYDKGVMKERNREMVELLEKR